MDTGIVLRAAGSEHEIDSSPSGTPPAISFGSHANYIRAFAMLAGAPTTHEKIARALATLCEQVRPSLEELERAAALAPATRGRVASSLKNAWGGEAWLAAGGTFATEGELLGLANNWGAVQAYYACYHAVQALLIAKGFPRHESHPKTQKQYISMWVDRPLRLAPWAIGHGPGGFINVPAGRTIDDGIRQMQPCTDNTCWDLAFKALHTTREKAIEEALYRARVAKGKEVQKAWLEEEERRRERGLMPRPARIIRRANLAAEERGRVERGVRPHGLIDYLFRLRIKSNYEDAAMFTEGSPGRGQSLQVHADLCYLASSTLLVHELRIARIAGPELMRRWVDNWLERNNVAGLGIGLALRRDLLVQT